MTPADSTSRPRVEGEREREIFDATIAVLTDVGYDRLTMDAVAASAKASKATLYRRWSDKATLVIDALVARKGTPPQLPDTGTLRGDLLAAFCGLGGMLDPTEVQLYASLLTALHRDESLAEGYRTRLIGPKKAASRAAFERAKARGEIDDDVDLDLLAPALAGIVLHRILVLGDRPDDALVASVVDQIIIPAATHKP